MTRPGGAARWLGILLLAACLLGARFALAEHAIEHVFHHHDEACIECLALPGFVAVPAAKPRLPSATPEPVARQAAVPPAPTFMQLLPFRSRAPPSLPSA